MSAIANAMARADRGLDWSYPCLIWIADYLRDETGRDYASDWRSIEWGETAAKHALKRLAAGGNGETAVEMALDNLARSVGWESADSMHQGAVMIGVFTSEDGIGVPAIFDGQDRWIVSNDGQGWASIKGQPSRIWEIACAAA